MTSSEVTDEPPTLIKEDLLPLSAQVMYLTAKDTFHIYLYNIKKMSVSNPCFVRDFYRRMRKWQLLHR